MADVRPYNGDVLDFLRAVQVPFGWTPREEDMVAFAPLVELDRALAAYDGDRVVGTAGIFSMQVTVPGGELPMAGVTMVGVHPTHRRQGLLRGMMVRQLEQIHERGEPLGGLWASEGAIYGRFGYGLATFGARFEVDRRRSTFREQVETTGSLRFVDAEEAAVVIPPVFDAARPERGGTFARSQAYWQAEFLRDPEHERNGGSPAAFVVHETDGRATGYARYRLYPEWDAHGPKSTLEVHEAIALTPAATRELWRYLLDVDLVATVRGRNLPVDHPLPLIVAEPRRLGWSVSDALWLRVVDVAAALGGRAWAADGSLVLEVFDDGCPWNGGRWQVEVESGQARVRPTDASADLALGVAELGAAYLGGTSLASLVLAGRVGELTDGAAEGADRMLRPRLAPWCPQVF